MKKVFCALIALMCVVACMLTLPIEADAATAAHGLSGNITWYLDTNGTLTLSGRGAMENYPYLSAVPWYKYQTSIEKVVISDGVTTIGDHAFDSLSWMTRVIIPDSVTFIGNHAFQYCYELTSVTIPDSVRSIGNYAFYHCDSLTSVIIPDGVRSIGDYAFQYCHSLTVVTIPDSVTTIGDGIINGGYSTTYVTYCGTEAQWNAISIGTDNTRLIYCRRYHSWKEATCTTPKTCSLCRKTEGDSLGHNWEEATCTTPKTCSVCDETVGDSLGHSWCEWIMLKHSTCKTAGMKARMCAVCSSQETQEIPALEHNYSGVVTQPTHTEQGYTTYSCMVCGYSYVDDIVEALGHSWSEWTVLSEVTCEQDGLRTRECDCGVFDSEIAYASGHSYDAVVTAPTHTEQGYTVYTCYICSYSYTVYEEALGHNWSTWIQVEASTCTTDGSQSRICACGAREDDVIPAIGHNYENGVCTLCGRIQPAKVEQWNMTLGDLIGVNFYVPAESEVAEKTQVTITVGGEKSTYDLTKFHLTEDGYQIVVHISAAQMTDEISLLIVTDGTAGEAKTYTIRQYADYILEDTNGYSDAEKNIVLAMLHYGGSAQICFGYNTNNLANAGIASVSGAKVPESSDAVVISDNSNDLDFYGASLVYRDRIAVRYYFTGDVNDCIFTANGNTYTTTEKDGLYYVEIADILPQNLDEEITLTVTDANGDSLAVCYNPMNYIVRMNEKGSEALKNLVKALYNYHLAAKALQENV